MFRVGIMPASHCATVKHPSFISMSVKPLLLPPVQPPLRVRLIVDKKLHITVKHWKQGGGILAIYLNVLFYRRSFNCALRTPCTQINLFSKNVGIIISSAKMWTLLLVQLFHILSHMIESVISKTKSVLHKYDQEYDLEIHALFNTMSKSKIMSDIKDC